MHLDLVTVVKKRKICNGILMTCVVANVTAKHQH